MHTHDIHTLTIKRTLGPLNHKAPQLSAVSRAINTQLAQQRAKKKKKKTTIATPVDRQRGLHREKKTGGIV